MIVYYRFMRTQDEEKKAALFEATVKSVNEIGFASSSVAKIAKIAGISPSTVYVYYENKQDLLVSTYVELKLRLAKAVLEDFDDSLPLRDIMKRLWVNMFNYISNNLEYNSYIEQFANSPYASLVDSEELDKHFMPLLKILQKGIEQKILKDVDPNFLGAFTFKPLSYLANPHLCHGAKYTEEDIEKAFVMAWDALKL